MGCEYFPFSANGSTFCITVPVILLDDLKHILVGFWKCNIIPLGITILEIINIVMRHAENIKDVIEAILG
jgi:hypothetical protein